MESYTAARLCLYVVSKQAAQGGGNQEGAWFTLLYVSNDLF
jgi:hypothetical protein